LHQWQPLKEIKNIKGGLKTGILNLNWRH